MRSIAVFGLVIALNGCGHPRTDSKNDRNQPDQNSVAFKAGEMTHELSKEAGKAAKAAGRELGKEAHQMREGWNQAQREDRAKRKDPDR